MGGNAFTNATCGSLPILRTPRMSPEAYQQLKTIYTDKLREYLHPRKVSILIEAPDKKSYGDLDFIVTSAEETLDWHEIAGQLGAAGIVNHNSAKVQRCSLAVPFDGSKSRDFNVYTPQFIRTDSPSNITVEAYVQIDLEVVPNELFEWHSFYSSYGDMCGMLGHMVHNLGFTICDRGLMLRLAALDDAKEMKSLNIPAKSGKLFLSKNPQKVLQFLGLSYETYQKGFIRADKLYRWLSQCRLLSKDSIKVKRDDASARQKESKRPLYRHFFHDWLPAYFHSQSSSAAASETMPEHPDPSSQRQDLATEAVAFFGKKAEYEKMNTALVRQIQCQVVDQLLKPLITQHSGFENEKRAVILRGFRRWISFWEDNPYILSTPHEDEQSELYKLLDEKDEMKLKDEARVSEWVKENWVVIKGLERERGKAAKSPT